MEKLIFVSHSGDKTGAPLVLARLFRLALRDIDVYLVFRYRGPLTKDCEVEFGASRVFTIRKTSPREVPKLLKPISKLVDLFLLVRIFKSLKPSIVITNTIINTTATIAGRLVGAKVIVWCHEVAGAVNDPFQLRSYWTKKAQAGIGVSKQSCDLLIELGLPRSKVHLVHNGIDLNPIIKGESVRKKKKPKDLLRIGALAIWSPNKRLDLIMEAAIELAKSEKFHQVHLDIGGPTDPWSPNLFEEAKTRFSERPENLTIRFLGRIERVDHFYHTIDCLMMTSDQESLPTVVIEALAYQVPVFSFDDLSGVQEILGEIALLAKERTGVALAAKVIQFFIDSADNSAYDRWQEAALNRARLFTLEKQWQAFRQIVQEIA